MGTGMADDKSIYPYVPRMIKFYLGEKPILPNVPTYLCREPRPRYVLDHLDELVVKAPTSPAATACSWAAPARRRDENSREAAARQPANYIAQPTLALSTCPTYVDGRFEARHIDLRPFVLYGQEVRHPGGLYPVALREGIAGRELLPGRRHQGHVGT